MINNSFNGLQLSQPQTQLNYQNALEPMDQKVRTVKFQDAPEQTDHQMDQLVTLAGLKTNQQLFTTMLIQKLADHTKQPEIHSIPTNQHQPVLLKKFHSQNQKRSLFLIQRSAKPIPLSTINNENYKSLFIKKQKVLQQDKYC